MSKPIFIVRFPYDAKPNHLRGASESLDKMGVGNDYHILIIKDQLTGGEIKFECYNAPHSEMEFEELKERVLSLLNNLNKNT